MRVVLPKLMAGGLLLAGLAVPALSIPQYGAPSEHLEQEPVTVPSHDTKQGQAPRSNPLRDFIKGRENEPAEKVFKNIQILKGVPAARFLDAMEGFSRSLGTKCRECHDTENFASDDKDEKKVARGMIQMTKGINEQFIKTMPGLDRDAAVSCFTCHHGQTHPASKPEGSGEEKEHEHHEGKPR